MTQSEADKAREVWNQKHTPVIYRGGVGRPLLFKCPYREDNRIWLQTCQKNAPVWNKEKRHWKLTKSAFNKAINQSLEHWGKIYIIQPFYEFEKCAPSCMTATGHVCQCSCMGENHGAGGPNSDWINISDAFSFRWREDSLACRLLTAK